MVYRQTDVRGRWAVMVIACCLTLVSLAMEKDIRMMSRPREGLAMMVEQLLGSFSPTSMAPVPSFAGAEDEAAAGRGQAAAAPTTGIPALHRPIQPPHRQHRLMPPPQPLASVCLTAPQGQSLTPLPLHGSAATASRLMAMLDSALDQPTHAVSHRVTAVELPPSAVTAPRQARMPLWPDPPAASQPRLPEPVGLLALLDQLAARLEQLPSRPHMVVAEGAPVITVPLFEVEQWYRLVSADLHRLIYEQGLEHTAASQTLAQLEQRSHEAQQIADALPQEDLAVQLHVVRHALHRHLALWKAVQACLDNTSVGMVIVRDVHHVRGQLRDAIDQLRTELGDSPSGLAWQQFLLLPELMRWCDRGDWQQGAELATEALSRYNDPSLSAAQRKFLARNSLQLFQSQLLAMGSETIDLRQLLREVEELETDSISRARFDVAQKQQVLRSSPHHAHRELAQTIDTYYRNANLRVALSGEFLERFLPEPSEEARPVRRNILGAETSGRSIVRTELGLQLIPDQTAWNVGLFVRGKINADTHSSKGPAVFFNTSHADVESIRYLRLSPEGYEVTSQPARVASRDYLRGLRTDFDGLPLLGDLVRTIAREQFDQRRGVAKRLTQRLIARETDAELDARLSETLSSVEQRFEEKVLGPLERLQLYPTIVDMHTTEDRLAVRYRIADESQMASFSPRPRAPADALVSLQLHESAFNNAIDRLGLGRRDWTLPELYAHLGNTLTGRPWRVPEDVPHDLTLRFAPTRPITIQIVDNKLRLTLRIAELSQPGKLHIERFVVTSSYVPVANGLSAELVRDGVIEILSRRDRLALRFIFAKVFVSRPEIPLINPAWQQDPRAEGLAVSQLELRDGWFALAVSPDTSPEAARVAERSRQLLAQ
ncbi:MAG: hypothetical protein KatS3mg111_4064 [Pirellulaceae bacterium]|nr:MAG: hypothetical protein KatS3mg111_4064 [Pirellulaceae bacterium]